MIFKITPKTAHERNRVREHGNLWETYSGNCVTKGDSKLLTSTQTGYSRWWMNDQIEKVVDNEG